MFQASLNAGRARGVLAAPDDLFFVAMEHARTLRACRGHLPRRRSRPDAGGSALTTLRNDVAGLFDQDAVAIAKILSRDVLGVVQRGHRDRRAGEKDRLENRVRRDRSGAPDVHRDLLEHGRRLLGRKLERRGPPRKLRRRPEPLAQGEVVDLDHDAVGVERQRAPLLCPLVAERDDFVDAGAARPVRFDRQSPLGAGRSASSDMRRLRPSASLVPLVGSSPATIS